MLQISKRMSYRERSQFCGWCFWMKLVLTDVARYIRACGKCHETSRGARTVEDAYRSTMADIPFGKVV